MKITPSFEGSTWTVAVRQPSNPHSKFTAWAKFALEADAHNFAEVTRARFTTWEVLVYHPRGRSKG